MSTRSQSMNQPDSKPRRPWKRRSLVVVAVILLPFVAFIAWPDRPLSSEEQRLVGRWIDQSVGHGNHTVEFRPNRVGKTTYGDAYFIEFDWSIQGGQLAVVPYQDSSQKNSIKNSLRHAVLVVRSVSTGSHYAASHHSMQWLDDDTLMLTTVPGSIIPAGLTSTIHRDPPQ